MNFHKHIEFQVNKIEEMRERENANNLYNLVIRITSRSVLKVRRSREASCRNLSSDIDTF